MLSDRLDGSLHRSILLRLARITVKAVSPEDGRFDHRFLSAYEGAAWLVCTLRLARPTPTGFEDLVTESDQADRIATVPAEDLPLVEDAIEAVVRTVDHSYGLAKQNEWPPDPDMFPATFDNIFSDLGFQEESGDWTGAALPMLAWNDLLADEVLALEVVTRCVTELAWGALEAMPQRVIEVMAEDAQAGRPGQRLADYLTQSWRPEGWLTPNERRVARTYMTNPLTRAVAKEILRLRTRAN
jgi:hypothetical protein